MFDIQRFADTSTYTQELQIKANFGEDDNRTITVPEARTNVTTQEIKDLENFLAESKILVGDKDGAAFTDIESAVLQETTRVKLDLNSLT